MKARSINAMNEFVDAAYTYAHASLTGEACDREDPCRKAGVAPKPGHMPHGVSWTCRVHKTARLIAAAHARLFPDEKVMT